MGGFTQIILKDNSQENIDSFNEELSLRGVKGCFRFYSERDVKDEFSAFLNKEGEFPEHLFPRDKINCYSDFKKYWSAENLGECFIPSFGRLNFDCYFGRTSDRQLKKLAKFVKDSSCWIEEVRGSTDTFLERGGYKPCTIKRIKKELSEQ